MSSSRDPLVDDSEAFARLVSALGPWHHSIVFVGGWAHRLYRLHPLASRLAYATLRTRDADVALSLTAPLDGDIAAALLKAGFQKEFSGEATPPITQYRLGMEDQGFYVEFLAPLHGDGKKKDGSPDVTVKQAGVTAQKLRHLDLLLAHPWSLVLTPDSEIPVLSATKILLPNPVSFLAQKLLIHKHRRDDKRAQDTLYIHDTLELFGNSLPEMRAIWLQQLGPMLPPKTAQRVTRLQRELFGEVSDELRSAARMPQDRTLYPDTMQAVCAYGLEEVFGDTSD